MSVTHWNAIIAVGISVTSLILLRACVIKPCDVWPGFKNEGREKEMTEKHAVIRPGYISKHQNLVRQVSEDQSTIPCIRHGVAAFCHSTVYRSAKA